MEIFLSKTINFFLDFPNLLYSGGGTVQKCGKFNTFFSFFLNPSLSDAETVKTILRNARHLVSDKASATPVPVYSPFLWLTGGEISKNKNSATHVPVNYVRTDNCEEKVKSMSDISEQVW